LWNFERLPMKQFKKTHAEARRTQRENMADHFRLMEVLMKLGISDLVLDGVDGMDWMDLGGGE